MPVGGPGTAEIVWETARRGNRSVKQVSGKELIKVLEREGWIMLRIHGSHHVYGKPGSPVRLSVPVHKNMPLKIGLAKHLLKMAGLSEDDL